MHKAIDFLAIGELLADLISTDYVNDLSAAKGFHIHSGGSPANVCANLQWMGANTILVSCVGKDSIGDFLIGEVTKAGLDASPIQRSRNYPTSIVLVGKSRGTPDFIAYRTADTQIEPIDKSLISNSRVIHTSSFALSKNPAKHNILEALSLAASQHKTISIDWNYAPVMWDSDGASVFQYVCSLHPLLKISLDDIARFTGKEISIEEAKTFLQKFPAKVICLTCGKDGVYYKSQSENEWTYQRAISIAEVKDTTGAGDAFWAGFLHAYLNQQPIANCVANGIEIAAKKIQTIGPLYTKKSD